MPAPIVFLLDDLERDLRAHDVAGIVTELDPATFTPRVLFLQGDARDLVPRVRGGLTERIPLIGPLRRPFWNIGLIRRFLLAVGDAKPAAVVVAGGRDALALAPRVVRWLERPAVYLAPSGDPRFPWDQRAALDGFAKIVASTGQLTLRLVDELSIPEKFVATIYPGIDVEHFAFRPPPATDPPLIGLVGEPPAAIADALQSALASTPGAPRLAAPRAKPPMIDLGESWTPDAVERVALLVFLPESAWDEGFGALLRGMAIGRAAIAAVPADRIDNLIQNGETGLLLVTDAPHAVSNAVAGLLSKPELLGSMGAAARMRIAGKFERSRWLAEHDALLRVVAGIAFPDPKPRGPQPPSGHSVSFRPSI